MLTPLIDQSAWYYATVLENRKNSDDRVVSHLELLLLVRLRTGLNFGVFFLFCFCLLFTDPLCLLYL